MPRLPARALLNNYVFISYADRMWSWRPVSQTTCARTGTSAWRDVEQIRPGQDWQKTLRKGAAGASAALYVASANSSAAHWAETELRDFLRLGRPVVPVVIDDVGAANVPAPLQERAWIDFRGDYQEAFGRLVRRIPDLLKRETPVAPAPEKVKGYVFLSYAEEDSAFADDLRRFLGGRGYAYWDYSESDRNYHTGFAIELEQVISQAAATLSLLSPEWKRSTWAMKEHFFSDEMRVPVFLLRVKEVPPTLAIAGLPYIDFVLDPSEGFKHLDRELARAWL